jgi:hypothetical protein
MASPDFIDGDNLINRLCVFSFIDDFVSVIGIGLCAGRKSNKPDGKKQ